MHYTLSKKICAVISLISAFIVCYWLASGGEIKSLLCWLTAAGAVISGGMLRLPPRYSFTFLTSIAILGSTIISVEVMLQSTVFQRDIRNMAAARDYKLERRRVSEFFSSTMKGKIQYWTSGRSDLAGREGLAMPDGHRVFPFLGERDSMRLICKEAGHWNLVQLDRYGFPENDALWDGPVDVAIAGGSDIFGGCVDEPYRIATRLRSTYPKTLNLSVGGTGPAFRTAGIAEYGRYARPKVVFWFLAETDFMLREFEWNFPFLMNYINDKNFVQDIEKYREILFRDIGFEPINATDEDLWPDLIGVIKIRGMDALRLNQVRGLAAGALGWRKATPDWNAQYFNDLPPDHLDEYVRFLNRSRHSVESWGGRMVIVMYSTYRSLQAGEEERTMFRNGFERIKSRLATERIEVVDLVPTMLIDGGERNAYPKPALHLNATGHATLTEAVMAYLGKTGP